jgi:hypothetical protein
VMADTLINIGQRSGSPPINTEGRLPLLAGSETAKATSEHFPDTPRKGRGRSETPILRQKVVNSSFVRLYTALHT